MSHPNGLLDNGDCQIVLDGADIEVNKSPVVERAGQGGHSSRVE